MAALAPSAIVLQICRPHSIHEQISALKWVRNDIIGNQQRKDVWLTTSGLLEAVVEAAIRRGPNNTHSEPDTDYSCASRASLSDSEDVRLQALAVLGSLASGGLRFVDALLSASALSSILSNLCPKNNPPVLVLASLRVLNALARSSLLSIEPRPANLLILADALFSKGHLATLSAILQQGAKSVDVDTQISHTASLISMLCCSERHRDVLASAGLVQALANVLAVVVVDQGLAIPRPGLPTYIDGLLRETPVARPEKVDIGGILQALATIIGDSKSRAYCLVGAPALQSIWHGSLLIQPSESSAHEARTTHNAIDYLNPQSPRTKAYMASSISSAFPPLGSHHVLDSELVCGHGRAAQSSVKESDYVELSSECSTPKSVHETESPIISYLIWMTRSSQDYIGLMSAYLLMVLYKVGIAARRREPEIALLVIPLIVMWLGEDAAGVPTSRERLGARSRAFEELTPTVLANLVLDSECLQKAAYDAGAVPRLCKILKSSYQPVTPALLCRSWSPQEIEAANGEMPSASPGYAFSPYLVHKIKVREGVLRAIAALIPFKEEYRKAVVDQGVMGIIVESLRPKPGNYQGDTNDGAVPDRLSDKSSLCDSYPALGINPVPVLAAACATIRHLSRSPSILRTTLVDSGVVMPIFELLHYPDVEVQIAATAAVCNIVTDMSPMRQTISEAGVLKVLCQHAHSKNVNMRYNALWALKHFVQAAGNETKKSCLRELGQEWLIRLICGDIDDEACGTASSARTPPDEDFDVQMGSAADEDDTSLSAYAHPELFGGDKAATEGHFGQHASAFRLSSSLIADKLLDDTKQARKDDTRVQEQGLDFLRNLIGGHNRTAPNVDNTEMITHLFDSFGEDDIFDVLTSKLRSKVHHPVLRDGGPRVCPPRPEILTAVGYVLVNIAASTPTHRESIMRRTELLRLFLQHSSHPVKDVRVAFCWLVINLTWVDNDQDSKVQPQRVKDLERLGYLSKLDVLVKDDDLDVRERAKTARLQMRRAI